MCLVVRDKVTGLEHSAFTQAVLVAQQILGRDLEVADDGFLI